MKAATASTSLTIKIAAGTILMLAAVWLVAFVVIDRNHSESIKLAEQRVLGKSQIFAQYTLSTIKRVDQIVLEARLVLEHNWSDFGRFIEQQTSLINDIAFQIAIIDRNGILVYSNIAAMVDKVDLSAREHYRVHLESQGPEHLFISRPVVGKVSRQWAIQFTRPIYKDNRFDGVLVVSVNPRQFGAFGQDLELGPDGVASVVRDTGERMARFPIDEKLYGQTLSGSLPIFAPNAPKSGTFSTLTTVDGVERIYGFTRLPGHGLTVLVGESLDYALAPHESFTRLVLALGLLATIFVAASMYFIFRWAVERALRKEAWQHANIDVLTGLPNRRAFLDQLDHEIARAERTGTNIALLFLDIDHFKNINDTLGHSAGDALLVAVSSRLRKSLRQVDSIARMGGDEFTIILSELSHAHDAELVCKKILTELAAPIYVGDKVLHVTTSIGVAIYPDDGLDGETMLKSADQAMYVSKHRGRNRYTFFSSAMQETTSKRMQLTNDLHRAIVENQLIVHYQPIVDLSTGRVCKAEALVRWQHPVLGLLLPAEFISYAKESGRIQQIDQWVLTQVATLLGSWPESLRKDFQISVNKSAIEFHSADDIRKTVETCQGLGSSIVVEITERVLMDDTPGTMANVMKVHESGIELSLDDFGTGYSSLSYIARFPATYLKIDQAFVAKLLRSNAREAVLCESIILLAHKLGIKVVAEGVETQSQSEWLASIGCDYVQGYFYYRPMTADALEKLVFASAGIASPASSRSESAENPA